MTTCQTCKHAGNRCKHPEGHGQPCYMPKPNGEKVWSSCDMYEPGTVSEPQQAQSEGPQQYVIQGYLSQQEEFNGAVNEMMAEGWQPMEFQSHPVAVEDGADVMLIRVMLKPG